MPPDADTSAAAGVRLRGFRGASDFPALAAVLTASENADGHARQVTADDLAAAYQNLVNCDPHHDMVLAEVAGQLAGYARGWWQADPAGPVYAHSAFVHPAWRRRGLGRALLAWVEDRLRTVAAGHPPAAARFFQAEAEQAQAGRLKLLEGAGYQPVRCFYEMVRPTLDGLPEWPLPAGLEVRPVMPEHYPAIWESMEAWSRDEWGYTPPAEGDYAAWLAGPHFQPALWQVAWDLATGETVGHVLAFVNHAENQQYGRRRGYTEGVGVAPAWRRRGVARALIALSLRAQRAAGLMESALAADSQNPAEAPRLYASCGFQVRNWNAVYRKPLT
ncbi:MAG: GNAT family N-acetyltransferase [Anaerolineales bacterium]|nr:GNAT family N-acetyltransferase [Anaerolineales bacterium]